ncbi:hypothetical protein QX776_18560 [Alteromonadaceae bacterium BrNp21-10]|nr:hypothetical protein [Alteromonadaceae bacterium BrNp21-10]
MSRIKGYPAFFYPSLMLIMLCMVLSGLLMLPSTLEFKLDWSVDWRLPGAMWGNVAATHALSGWLMSIMVGALWQVHMRGNWRKSKHKVTGLTNALLFLTLGATAVGLYYAGEASTQLGLAFTHIFAGLLLILVFTVHALFKR